jgi:2-amino-4-hydroxy-6-hydroxymethyldihydropteridine diphosphokinase
MVKEENTRQRNLAYLMLGSNIEPERNLRAAVRHLSRFGCIRAVSAVWETAPIGFPDQPNYLNAAVLLETGLSPLALREEAIVSIEAALGRVRTKNKYAPRTIDIDIMLFNDEVLQIGHRHIPDLEVLERPFVAVALAEIAPDYKHPQTGETLQEIARGFSLASSNMQRRDDIHLAQGVQMIRVKRVYESPEVGDGARFLVERLWPRGVKKASLKMEAWLKDVAPSDGLRSWFGHDPAKWDEFQIRYRKELDAKPDALQPVIKASLRGEVTLLYSARDTEHNNAVALKSYLEEILHRPA